MARDKNNNNNNNNNNDGDNENNNDIDNTNNNGIHVYTTPLSEAQWCFTIMSEVQVRKKYFNLNDLTANITAFLLAFGNSFSLL